MTPDEVDLKSLTDDQLTTYLHRLSVEAGAINNLISKAKEEIGSRATKPGTKVLGDICLTLTRPSRFSDELAQANLPKSTYRKLLVTKADSTKAKEILGDGSQAYKDCCEQGNWTIKIGAASTKNKVLAMDGKLDDPFSTDEENAA